MLVAMREEGTGRAADLDAVLVVWSFRHSKAVARLLKTRPDLRLVSP